MAGQAASLYYFSAELRGFEEYMADLAQEPELISVLLDRVLEWMMEFTSHYLDEIGDYIEGWWMGDDWGMQTGPIMSPNTFRAVFKPRYKRLIDLVKSKTKAKVCLHTCGATYWILQDLVDVGVDVVHPLQPTAMGNEDPVAHQAGIWGSPCFLLERGKYHDPAAWDAPGRRGGSAAQDCGAGSGRGIHFLRRTQHSSRRATRQYCGPVRYGL